MLLNTFKILLGNDFLNTFLSSDYSQVNILLLTHIASSRTFMETKESILDQAHEMFGRDLHCEVTGLGTVIAASSHLLTVGQVKSLSLSLGLIFAVMVALFLSSKVGLIAVVPNIFPILVNFGLMGLLGIPLSTATALIASIAIGLAVDDTIHYLVRYNSEFKKDLDKDRAMRATVLSVGRPIIFTSCTISLGFAVLLFSHFQPTAIFGMLMVVTMASALVGDLILLPALMMHVELVTAWDLLKLIPTLGGIPPGLVHELNQPLNAIKVGSEFLKMMLKRTETVRSEQLLAVATEISRQVNRASRLIERIGEAGKTPGFDKAALQINQPLVSTLDILENQLKLDNIQIELELGDPLAPIYGHYHSLNQVFYNLITNAWEAVNNKAASQDPG
jgi:predicted exporter